LDKVCRTPAKFSRTLTKRTIPLRRYTDHRTTRRLDTHGLAACLVEVTHANDADNTLAELAGRFQFHAPRPGTDEGRSVMRRICPETRHELPKVFAGCGIGHRSRSRVLRRLDHDGFGSERQSRRTYQRVEQQDTPDHASFFVAPALRNEITVPIAAIALCTPTALALTSPLTKGSVCRRCRSPKA
jgi:hypothetical protein